MEIINFTRLHPIFSILAKHNHTGFPYPIILNFRKPLTRNWSSWAKFLIVKQPSFVITSFYELITITLDSINMIIIFSLDAFPIRFLFFKSSTHVEKRKRPRTYEKTCRVAEKFRKNACFISSSTSARIGRLSPSRWKSSPRYSVFLPCT